MLAMSKTHCILSRITYSIPTSLAVLLEVYRITVQVIQYGLVFSAYAYLEKSSNWRHLLSAVHREHSRQVAWCFMHQ